MIDYFVGSCQLALGRLTFDSSREPNPSAIRRLSEVLRLSCDPMSHQIPVVVSPEELQTVLDDSNVSREALVENRQPYPELFPSAKLRGIHGRQRFEAALRVYGSRKLWTVQLYCIPAGSDVYRLLQPEVDQYFYQTPPSDGEIFLKIRENKGPGQVDIAKLWRLKLSSYKQKVLGTVERQSGLLEKLDQLRAFPGLWNGFQLGNMEKHLKLHTPEEVSHYLQHVHKTWQLITLDDPTIQKATDFQTVKRLELLAPAVFSADGAEVRRLISDGTLFPSVSAPSVRARIQDAMLQIVGLIPSITTFHQNMMLLSIVAKILRRHIVGDARSGSLRSAMMGCWQAPEKMLIEEAENSFCKLHFPPSFDLAYRQVFMSALRHFSRLSVVGPRCERGQSMNAAMVDDQYLAQFLRGAWKQGFRSVKIEATLAQLRD